MCEMLNILVLILSAIVINTLFNDTFLYYGVNIVINGRWETMSHLFPKVASCSMKMYGFSGGITNIEFLCVLPHSNLHQWIVLGLWAMMTILFCLGVAGMARRVFLVCSPKYRAYWMWGGGSCQWKMIRKICHELNVRKWMYFYSFQQLTLYIFLVLGCFLFDEAESKHWWTVSGRSSYSYSSQDGKWRK